MDRALPTDPPDEPVNRVAGAMAKMEGKLVAREETAQFLEHLREAFASLLEIYQADLKGDHRDAVVRITKKHFGGPRFFLTILRPITQNPTGRLAEATVKMLFGEKDFASCAALVPLIIRDLEKPDDGSWIAP